MESERHATGRWPMKLASAERKLLPARRADGPEQPKRRQASGIRRHSAGKRKNPGVSEPGSNSGPDPGARGPCVGPVESWGPKANREGSVPDPPETQGVYQMGDVQARSWTTGTCAGLQHPSKPAVMVEGSSQETPESAQIC